MQKWHDWHLCHDEDNHAAVAGWLLIMVMVDVVACYWCLFVCCFVCTLQDWRWRLQISMCAFTCLYMQKFQTFTYETCCLLLYVYVCITTFVCLFAWLVLLEKSTPRRACVFMCVHIYMFYMWGAINITTIDRMAKLREPYGILLPPSKCIVAIYPFCQTATAPAAAATATTNNRLLVQLFNKLKTNDFKSSLFLHTQAYDHNFNFFTRMQALRWCLFEFIFVEHCCWVCELSCFVLSWILNLQ